MSGTSIIAKFSMSLILSAFCRFKAYIKAMYGLIEKCIWIEYLMDDGCAINTGPRRLRGFHQIDIQTCLLSYRY